MNRRIRILPAGLKIHFTVLAAAWIFALTLASHELSVFGAEAPPASASAGENLDHNLCYFTFPTLSITTTEGDRPIFAPPAANGDGPRFASEKGGPSAGSMSPAAAEPEPVYPTTQTPSGAPITASLVPVRSEQLEAIARQADRQIRHGFELAGRGAYFAARSEFITALRLLAQGLDTQQRTSRHSKALAAGLTALKEAEDFLPQGAKLEADLDLSVLIGGHTTPALKDHDPATLTPLAAIKAYLTFAQRQLAEAAEKETAGSMALHALGKLHEELANKKTTGIQAAGPKAVVFYQAALSVCPQNFMTANDLGVLLAKSGNYPRARAWLELSAALSQSSTVWGNLAVVYERLGRNDLAQSARQQVQWAQERERNRRQNQALAADGAVRWVDTKAFGAPGWGIRPDLNHGLGAGPASAPQSPRHPAPSSPGWAGPNTPPNNARTPPIILTPWNRDFPSPTAGTTSDLWR
jgi:tetratricopeptide (TPR) repeat protein